MTNKRKSMSIGDDVHALSARGAQPQIYLRSKGFRDAALTSLGPQGHCLQLFYAYFVCRFFFLLFQIYLPCSDKGKAATDKRIKCVHQICYLLRSILYHGQIQDNTHSTADQHQTGVFDVCKHGQERDQDSKHGDGTVQQNIIRIRQGEYQP